MEIIVTNSHYISIAGAFFVTMLWSSSWVLIKIGLTDISPLVFAGIRYVFASLILGVRLLVTNQYRAEVKNLTPKWWVWLIIYGVLYYAITQGSQFVGLFFLPAITVSFMLNLTSVFVLLLGIGLLQEYPSGKQFGLIGLGVIGVILFFYPVKLPTTQILGLTIVLIGVFANAISSILGRKLNQQRKVSAFVITTISMLFGSFLLLGFALFIEGVPILTLKVIYLIIWLAVVNTAIAFVIWNYTLQELTAIESSLINSSMLPQITVLAMIFFDETLIIKEWIGLGLIFVTSLFISILRK